MSYSKKRDDKSTTDTGDFIIFGIACLKSHV